LRVHRPHFGNCRRSERFFPVNPSRSYSASALICRIHFQRERYWSDGPQRLFYPGKLLEKRRREAAPAILGSNEQLVDNADVPSELVRPERNQQRISDGAPLHFAATARPRAGSWRSFVSVWLYLSGPHGRGTGSSARRQYSKLRELSDRLREWTSPTTAICGMQSSGLLLR
jgi:hypothetical protein